MGTSSFEEFARASLPALVRYAYALTGSVHAGEDLVQDTLVKVARAWRRVHDEGNPLAYAKVTMLRTYLSFRRTLLRRPRTEPLLLEPAGPDAYARTEARDLLRRALAGLPRDQRAVVVLGYLDDLPDAEIAELLNRRPATVRSLRHRALATLRSTMAGHREEDARGQC